MTRQPEPKWPTCELCKTSRPARYMQLVRMGAKLFYECTDTDWCRAERAAKKSCHFPVDTSNEHT